MNAISTHKEAQAKALRERFDRATASVLVDFVGLDVGTITALRAELRKVGVDYAVVKNTLVEKALLGTPFEDNQEFKTHLKGPTAVAWSYEDPSAAAKAIKAFFKGADDDKKLTVKCAIMDSQVLSAARVEGELANLPSKDELRAMLLSTLMAGPSNLVRQLTAAGQQLTYALSARERSLGADQA
ncbi:MAG: 50S ribosomal protein L10 [Myxococcales bacterium]|nr:50S ribosomal protein L10 [Myxococcales bacterium]MCB9707969.1 50S ribosomal protein L10 [Myxococcales bacterium]